MIKALLKMFGIYREPTLQNIVKPMSAIVGKLQKFADDQSAASIRSAEEAEAKLKQASELHSASLEAKELASRYSTLTI